MSDNNPLHGITLSTILDILIEKYGFEELSMHVKINCFAVNPSKKSSLKFLRKTQWARDKVEALYVENLSKKS